MDGQGPPEALAGPIEQLETLTKQDKIKLLFQQE